MGNINQILNRVLNQYLIIFSYLYFIVITIQIRWARFQQKSLNGRYLISHRSEPATATTTTQRQLTGSAFRYEISILKLNTQCRSNIIWHYGCSYSAFNEDTFCGRRHNIQYHLTMHIGTMWCIIYTEI